MKPSKMALRVLAYGGLGVLILLAINTACNLMQYCGSGYAVAWIGAKFHDAVINFGNDLGIKCYGAVKWGGAPWHILTVFHVGPLMLLGFLVGMGAGVLSLAVEWMSRRGEGAAAGGEAAGAEGCSGLVIPAHWPLVIAAAGIFFHGYLLGLAALLLAGRTRAKPWLVWTTRAFGAAVSLFWSVGTEQYWTSGWSVQYPIVRDTLKISGAWVGRHKILCVLAVVVLAVAVAMGISAYRKRVRADAAK